MQTIKSQQNGEWGKCRSCLLHRNERWEIVTCLECACRRGFQDQDFAKREWERVRVEIIYNKPYMYAVLLDSRFHNLIRCFVCPVTRMSFAWPSGPTSCSMYDSYLCSMQFVWSQRAIKFSSAYARLWETTAT